MALGEGKYDSLCTVVRTLAHARGAVVLIIDGEHGHGFSLQADVMLRPRMIAETLRRVADEIDKDEPKAKE